MTSTSRRGHLPDRAILSALASGPAEGLRDVLTGLRRLHQIVILGTHIKRTDEGLAEPMEIGEIPLIAPAA